MPTVHHACVTCAEMGTIRSPCDKATMQEHNWEKEIKLIKKELQFAIPLSSMSSHLCTEDVTLVLKGVISMF